MSSLPQFLGAIALTLALAYGGHYYWLGQYGANFTPGVALDISQVIDRTEHHGLLAV